MGMGKLFPQTNFNELTLFDFPVDWHILLCVTRARACITQIECKCVNRFYWNIIYENRSDIHLLQPRDLTFFVALIEMVSFANL